MRVVALLTIRRAELERARGYEHAVARIMARHGGQTEHAFELAGTENETVRELHIVRFPDEEAFAAYRADPERATYAADRELAIIATEVWPATELPPYGRPR